MTTESHIAAEIYRVLGSRSDLRIFRRNVGALRDHTGRLVRFNLPGMADFWGVNRAGRHFELEVKSATGRLSEDQERWRAFCLRWKIGYVLARSTADAVAGIEEWMR